MAFRRFDHIDEIINVTRAIGDTIEIRAAEAKIASLQWLLTCCRSTPPSCAGA